MKKSWAIFFAVWVWAVAAVAQPAEVFTVSGVEGQSTNSNLQKAQNEAVEAATQSGFEQLLRSIVPVNNHYQIQRLLEQANANSMLARLKIISETTSPSYTLTADLFFDKSAVRKLLEKNRIPYSEAGDSTVMLMPLMYDGTTKLLWSDANVWKSALTAAASQAAGPIRFVMPDTQNRKILTITPDMAAFGATDILLDAAAEVAAENVVVASAWVSGQPYSNRSIKIALNWYGKAGFAPLEATIPLPQGQTFADGVSFAAQAALQKLQEQWQTESLIQLDRPDQVFVRFAPKGPQDLERLKTELSGLSIVKNVKLRVLNTNASLFEIDFFGDIPKLRQAMEDRGLRVSPQGNVWVVELPALGL